MADMAAEIIWESLRSPEKEWQATTDYIHTTARQRRARRAPGTGYGGGNNQKSGYETADGCGDPFSFLSTGMGNLGMEGEREGRNGQAGAKSPQRARSTSRLLAISRRLKHC